MSHKYPGHAGDGDALAVNGQRGARLPPHWANQVARRRTVPFAEPGGESNLRKYFHHGTAEIKARAISRICSMDGRGGTDLPVLEMRFYRAVATLSRLMAHEDLFTGCAHCCQAPMVGHFRPHADDTCG